MIILGVEQKNRFGDQIMSEPKTELERRMDRIEEALQVIAENLPYPNLQVEVEDILNKDPQKEEPVDDTNP